MKSWIVYGGGSAILLGAAALAGGLWLSPQARLGLWTGLGVAWSVQLIAFAILVEVARRRPGLVIAGWTAGTLLRLIALGALGWLTVAEIWALPPTPTLLGLAGALFVLMLLEPLVFRMELQTG